MAREVWAPWGGEEAYLEALVAAGTHPQLLGNTPAAQSIMTDYGYSPPTETVPEEELEAWEALHPRLEGDMLAAHMQTTAVVASAQQQATRQAAALPLEISPVAPVAEKQGIPSWLWVVGLVAIAAVLSSK